MSTDTRPVPGKTYRVADKPCNICGKSITWEFRVGNSQKLPGHCDSAGYIIGDGMCPGKPEDRVGSDKRYVASPVPITPGSLQKRLAEARIDAVRVTCAMTNVIHLCDALITKISGEYQEDDGSRLAVQWNTWTNEQRATYLAVRLSHVLNLTVDAIIAKATNEIARCVAGTTILDILVKSVQNNEVSIPIEVAGVNLS